MGGRLINREDHNHIQTITISECPICRGSGHIHFSHISDKLYFIPGQWNICLCETCESFWLENRPLPESISQIYPTEYYTHAEPWNKLTSGGTFASILLPAKHSFLHHAYGYPKSKTPLLPEFIGYVTASIAYLRWMKDDMVRFLPANNGGLLLDIGCGNGEFLLTMKRLGWRVRGIEPDADAATVAQRHGIDVEVASIDDTTYLEDGYYDAITMSHVIEHLPDPVAAVRKVASALKQGGRFVTISPNPRSALGLFFGQAWVHWDPPRHFSLPSSKGLNRLAASSGLAPTVFTRTPDTNGAWVARNSLGIRRHQNATAYRGTRLPSLIESVARIVELVDRSRGDEVVLIGRK